MELTNRILVNKGYRERLRVIEEYEADRIFCRHDMEHFLDVARIAYALDLERGYGLSKDLIYAAALLHDIGRAEEYRTGQSHDEAGADIAEVVLVECDATAEYIRVIKEAIQTHRGQDIGGLFAKDGKGDILSRLIKEADKLSRPCFSCQASPECKWPEEKKNNKLYY
ncbi:MAG: HD domain-containing protein [Lachnospiraceae bacterium]|nr:HD domain-containing protein [Lachnospiraceae bacterium]